MREEGGVVVPYYGPRFYRVTYLHSGKPSSMTFHDRRSEARAYAKRITTEPWAADVTLETLDDRYPANVLESEIY